MTGKRRDKSSGYPDAFLVKEGDATARTWRFGTIHQSVVDICGERIGLLPAKSVDEALDAGLAWYRDFKSTGSTVNRVVNDCFNNWPDIYRTIADVYNQIFFTIGNGYSWIDGQIVCCGPYDHLTSAQNTDYMRQQLGKHLPVETLDEIFGRKDLAVGPMAELDPVSEREFYPISMKYSNICNVPKDVTDDWLVATWVAASMLRDRSPDGSPNKVIGQDEVLDLGKRFGPRLSALGLLSS